MVWTYHQSTGKLERNGKPVANGYSGAGQGTDNPALQHSPFIGPIPRGTYKISAPYDTKNHGPHVMALAPVGHNALGRDHFLIHGDNSTHTASQGCIILNPVIRKMISSSSDSSLEVVEGPRNLSGKAWWHANQGSYPNSAAVADLAPGFRGKVETFIAALRKAGAIVTPNATRRNKTRAYLMHYSFKLAKGMIRAKDIPAVEGCVIIWDHGDVKKSRIAAREMVRLFDIVFQPSLTSLHISGNAIDMNIAWTGTMKIVDGKGVTREIGAPASGAKNAALHKVGGTYGVYKLLSDAPHWSSNGH